MKTLRSDIPEDVLQMIDKAAAVGIPAARANILEAFRQLTDPLTTTITEDAIASGSAVGITSAMDWVAFAETLNTIFGESGPLEKTWRSAARRTLAGMPVNVDAVEISEINTRAVAWLAREGGRLITVISENTRDAVTEIVQSVFLQPDSLANAAREIVKVKGFGLTRPQTTALRNYAAGLIADSIGKSRRRKMIDREFKRKLKHRAKVVAQTEAYKAGNVAQGEAWGAAVAAGNLSANDWVLEWVTRVINVCPRCQALDGRVSEISNGIFTSRTVEGGTFDGQVVQVNAPPVHPFCYCARRLIKRADAIDEALLG